MSTPKPYPLTTITIVHYEENLGFTQYYERPGPLQVQEQLTSWARECAVDFWNKLKEKERERTD